MADVCEAFFVCFVCFVVKIRVHSCSFVVLFEAVFSEDIEIAWFDDARTIANHERFATGGENLSYLPFHISRSLVTETDVGIGVNTLERNAFHVWIIILCMFRHVFGVTLNLLLGPLEIPRDRLSAVIRLDAVAQQWQRFKIWIGVHDNFEFRPLFFDIVDDVVVVINQLPKIEVVFVLCRIF